ncbi:T9SS type A sorting domain-containing protein [candidate division TA06 bacterium]|nr:T9SS type A sorting domain-containing protein [candidate division TA06 bacterium]
MFRRARIAACTLSVFSFLSMNSSADLFIGSEDMPFVLGTYAEYTQNAGLFNWTPFDSTATIWDLTVYPGSQTATVRLLDPNLGNPPAPDTFPSSQMVELDTLGGGQETWSYMSKDSFYLYGNGIDFVSGFRFIGNYQPDYQIYFFPMFYGNGWNTAWMWIYDIGLIYTANETHQKQIVAKGWVKTEITGNQYWPCLVIRDNYIYSDNFGTLDTRWLYEWVVAGRFAGGNGIAAAISTNGASKDFVIVDDMLRLKSLNVPGWDLTCPNFDSTTVWTDTSFAGPYPVSSIITDSGGIGADSLFYQVNSGSFVGVSHDSVQGNKYFFTIPPVFSSSILSYYLWAKDSFSVVNSIDIWTTDPEAAPENNLITFNVTLTGIEEVTPSNSPKTVLSVYPNPFTSSVLIRASMNKEGGPKTIRIVDPSGRTVQVFDLSEYQRTSPGRVVEFVWPGTDERGKPLPSGIYFMVFEDETKRTAAQTVKLIKVR